MKKYSILLFAIPFLFTSCIKDDLVKLTDQGSTLLVAAGGTEKELFFNPFTDVKRIALFDIHRNVPSNAVLNSTGTVKLKAAPEFLDGYNEEHGTDFEWLPSSIFNFSNVAGVTASGDEITLTYSPGDFAKEIAVDLDGAKWDLSHKYALAYRISDPGNAKVSEGNEIFITFISVKNIYDGVYKINSGFVQRYSNPTTPTVDDALNGPLDGNPNVTLSTIDANTVEISGLTWAGGTSGVAGINNLRARVDPVTNGVTMFALGNATLANREGFENTYDPAAKTFTLNFDWNQTASKREIGLVIQWAGER
ncbi:MAG: DUF1735 domain-containing protein [Leadbetterella sp.]|nr:DUF1735 domain-containing protein [Leadbetterella sp.]